MESVEFQTLFAAPLRNGVYKSKEFQGRGVRLVKMKQLFGERRLCSTSDGYELIELSDKERQKLLLAKNDLLFSRTSVVADGVGKCSLVVETNEQLTWDSNIIRVRIDASRGCPEFYFYFFNSPVGRDTVKRLSSGAAVTTITGTGLAACSVPHPPLPLQHRIAGVLSAYDELIENNLRRIQILEEMAQALYREWFVEFRFPGSEVLEFVESETGRIPSGWESGYFTDVAEILSGGTPKTSRTEYWNGVIPFFSPKDAPASFFVTKTERQLTEVGLENCSSSLYEPETVFITARGTVGKVVLPAVPMAMNQSCYALRGREGVGQLYLFLAVRDAVEYLRRNTGGATFPTIIVDTFRRMPVLRPSNPLISQFEEVVRPTFSLLRVLLEKNEVLRVTRDLLLPRLISGELDVSELDMDVGDAA